MKLDRRCRPSHKFTEYRGLLCADCGIPKFGTPSRYIFDFWRHVNKSGSLPDNKPELGNCWLWMGRVKHDGYGQANVCWPSRTPHRIAFYLANGYWPQAPLEVDHLCKRRLCCRPTHLEAVTKKENHKRKWATKTTCKRGHPLADPNLYYYNTKLRGRVRRCLTCIKAAGIVS